MKLIDKVTVKYGIIGVVNTLIGTGVMFGAYNLLGFSYWASSAANYIIGSICSYFLNRSFTFQNKAPVKKTLMPFILNISICYLLAYGIAKPLALKLLSGFTQSIQENVAMVIGMGLFVILNYIGQRFIVFKPKKGEENEL